MAVLIHTSARPNATTIGGGFLFQVDVLLILRQWRQLRILVLVTTGGVALIQLNANA